MNPNEKPNTEAREVESDTPEWLKELIASIAGHYAEGIDLRVKLAKGALNVGREIIAASMTERVAGELSVENARKGTSGGAPCKPHTWVCKRVAASAGYNEDYLRKSARNYLALLNKDREKAGREAIGWSKGGQWDVLLDDDQLPLGDVLVNYVLTTEPLAENIAGSDEVGQEISDAEKAERDLMGAIQKMSGVMAMRLNPKLTSRVVEHLNSILPRHGYRVVQSQKQS